MTQIKKLLLYISIIVFAICSRSWAEDSNNEIILWQCKDYDSKTDEPHEYYAINYIKSKVYRRYEGEWVLVFDEPQLISKSHGTLKYWHLDKEKNSSHIFDLLTKEFITIRSFKKTEFKTKRICKNLT